MMNEQQKQEPVAVGGRFIEGTINGFLNRANVLLRMEQEKIAPDNSLIAFLCDAVRMTREYLDYVATPQDAQDAKRYQYAVQHLSLAHQLGIKPKPISCPDKIEGCLVAHYAPVTKAEVDAAIDAAMREKEE